MGIVPYREFVLSDGTTDTDTGILHAVDLLDRVNGFCITDWRMAVAEPKSGGVWADSALADGRFLKVSKLANVQETITVEIVDFRADGLADRLHLLYDLLEQARNWGPSGWSSSPVWIEAVGVNESNVRYALVHDYRTPGAGYPFGQPFWQAVLQAGIPEFEIVLEREPTWRGNAPGDANCVLISASQSDYSGTIYGNYDPVSATIQTSCNGEFTYIANKHNAACLTHIFVDDGGAFGANLLAGNPPYSLLPAVPQAADAVYFGISSTVTPTGPFCSLIFDLSQAQAGIANFNWEIWDGAAWASIEGADFQDNTDGAGVMTGASFDTTGIHSLHWAQDASWSTSNVNGVTAYWVRAEVQDAGTQPPIQQNRHVYTDLWPFFEVQSDELNGNVSAWARIYLRNQSHHQVWTRLRHYNRVLVGVRSVSRGAYYSPYINFANVEEQNFAMLTPGATMSTQGGALIGTIESDMESPSGQVLEILTPGAEVNTCFITMSKEITEQYQGTFHLYIRGYQNAGDALELRVVMTTSSVGPISLRIEDAFHVSEWVAFQSSDQFELMDFGPVTIDTTYGDFDYNLFTIMIQARGDGASSCVLYDLILFPIDEWAADAIDVGHTESSLVGYRGFAPSVPGVGGGYGQILNIDAISDPRRWRVTTHAAGDDSVFYQWQGIAASGPVLLPQTRQRVWFLSSAIELSGSATGGVSYPETCGSAQAWATERYLLMRGDK